MSEFRYYVYVYIDPRDFSEFYYGKGVNDRKFSHLSDDSDSEKARLIKEILAEGLTPIIKVIAKDLTEEQAFLIEKTLIWKLGKNLTNKSSGHFAEKFRPHKTLHKEVFGFDYSNGIYFFNCGDSGECSRKWEHFKEYGFITAGGGPAYSGPIRTFEVGDLACVYLSKHGYVGIGVIESKAIMAPDFRLNGKGLRELGLPEYLHDEQDESRMEYMCKVRWICAVERKNAFFKRKSGMYTPMLVKASMQNHPETLKLLEDYFQVRFTDLLGNPS